MTSGASPEFGTGGTVKRLYHRSMCPGLKELGDSELQSRGVSRNFQAAQALALHIADVVLIWALPGMILEL